jgi:hypothetical protein
VRVEQEQWALNPVSTCSEHSERSRQTQGRSSRGSGACRRWHSVAFASGQTANPRASAVIVTAQESASRLWSEGSWFGLRTAVFDQLEPVFDGCKKLFIAPDGDLNCFPFETLPDRNGRLILEDFEISYLSCGRDLLRFGARSVDQTLETRSAFVVADPAFNLTLERPGSPPVRLSMRRRRVSGYRVTLIEGSAFGDSKGHGKRAWALPACVACSLC